MSISRRKFLKVGTVAGLFAGLPLGVITALGQGLSKDRDGNPVDQASTNDALALYTKATFASYLNSVFVLNAGYRTTEVTLLQITDMPAVKGGECFTLLFRGGSSALPQDTYTVNHPSLGTFKLLLVPAGTDANGAQGYLATINRLPLSASLSNAPTRVLSKPSGTVKPEVTDKPASTGAPAPTTAPKPAKTKKPAGRKKPSWKRNDGDFEGDLIDQ